MKRCLCGNRFSSAAEFCPSCGRKYFPIREAAFGVVLAAIAIAFLVAFTRHYKPVDNLPQSEEESTQTH